MDSKQKFDVIQACIDAGEWGNVGDIITRNDLMAYLLHMNMPTINAKGNIIKAAEPVNCPLCGSSTKTQPFSLTYRAVSYLMCAVWLSKKNIAEGGDGFVHYELIHDMCQQKFLYEKGKKLGKGVSFTSYSTLTKAPWNFLQSEVDTNYKPLRTGNFIPTQKCRDFLNGLIGVPERVEFMDGQVVRESNKIVYAAKVKNVQWSKMLQLYKTF